MRSGVDKALFKLYGRCGSKLKDDADGQRYYTKKKIIR